MRTIVRCGILGITSIAMTGCSSSAPSTAESREAAGSSISSPVAMARSVDASERTGSADDLAPESSTTLSNDDAVAIASPALPAVARPTIFRAEDGAFQVQFPVEPETTREDLQDGSALVSYRAAANGIERQVNAFDLAETMTRESAEETLEDVVRSIIEAANGYPKEREVVANADYPAVRYDYVYEAAGERFRTAGLFAVVGDRQYQASVLATEEAWDVDAAAEFLASFRPTLEAPLTAARSADADVTPTRPLSIAPAATLASRETAVVDGVERKLPWVEATVRFPTAPESLGDEATEETERMFHAFDGKLSYSVNLYREEEPLPIEIAREALKATAEAIATSVDGTVLSSEPTENARFAEHRLAYEYADDESGTVRVRQRLLYVEATQVYLIVAGPADAFDEVAAERFLESWSMTDAVADAATTEAR